MDEPPWKKLKLSLERPYKNDSGDPIPVLLDITPDGPIYEVYDLPIIFCLSRLICAIRKDDPSKSLGEKLRRIFVERGVDFFDKNQGGLLSEGILPDTQKLSDVDADTTGNIPEEGNQHTMTPEELFKMRMEILPQL